MKASDKKAKKFKRKITLPTKILLGLIGIVAVVAAILITYNLIHYKMYKEYKKYAVTYEYETGKEFVALKDSSPKVEGMVLAAENDYLKLYTDTASAQIAVYDKRNGKITYSTPKDVEDDPVANPINKKYMKSQFVLEFYNSAMVLSTFDSFSMAVEREQVEVQAIENGIRYIYTLGDFTKLSTGIVPLYMSQEKLDEILGQLEKKADQTKLKAAYIESDIDGVLALRENTAHSPISINGLTAVLEKVGFTEEDYAEQMALGGEKVEERLSFVVPLEYRLVDDGINVSIPASELKESGGGMIYRLRLLGFFGAAGADETGYMVVPNGSGSIINFNNGKNGLGNYSQYIYTLDPIASEYTQVENQETARLPIAAICRPDSSILMSVENGTTVASINASLGGLDTSYNSLNTIFVMRFYDKMEMFGATGNEQDLPILEPNIFDVNYTVRYAFLTEENKGYSGVANYYRNRLIAEGKLTPNTAGGDIPFYYDVLGGVKETESFLGIQYLKVKEMTTFKEAMEIVKSLNESGIKNQVLNYQGWSNGGYFADTYDKITKLGTLGGKKNLEALDDLLKENGGTLFVDVPFQKVTDISKRYSASREGARYYGAGYIAKFGLVSPMTLRKTYAFGYEENIYSLISPKFLPRYVEKFAKAIQKVDVSGISLRDLGDVLSSDKKRTEIINREAALYVVLGQFEKLKALNKPIMVAGGNDYAFEYADHIIDVPMKDNDFRIIDEEIPLYEMIIHGCINYAGGIMNYKDSDYDTAVLKMIEYGASPRYQFTWETSSEMKKTALNRFYSTEFSVWNEDAVKTYNTVNGVLKNVSGATIVNHEILSAGVRKVTYSNGCVIYVNYNNKEVSVDGHTINAKSFYTEVK